MTISTETEGFTRKQLVDLTGCRPYLIDYYRSCGYLPILRDSTGPGIPVLYHPDAISVIRKLMERHLRKNSSGADET